MDILKKIKEILKKIFQSSDNSHNKTSIELNQNDNNGTITNNIGVKPSVEKNEEGDFTLNFDHPQIETVEKNN